MKEPLNIRHKKNLNQFKKDSRIKECFHFDKSSCSNQIISAHSIQRGGVLDLIEDNVEGNLAVYSFLNRKLDENGSPIGFEPLGKKAASTFFGFCGYHDNEIFKAIENDNIDLENDEHCFLLSYRAFAKEFHSKQESLKGYMTNDMFQNTNFIGTEGLINGSEMGLRDCKIVKERMNQILENKNYDELEYLTYELDYIIPIAAAASINPDYTYKNEILNNSPDPNVIYEFVNFVIQPIKCGKTIIVLSCLPEHKSSVKFLDQLNDLKPLPFEKAIGSLAIANVENTFFSPRLWCQFSQIEKNQLMKELLITNPMFRDMFKGFFHSKLYLFDKKFQKIIK
jgi:hypothetical protein